MLTRAAAALALASALSACSSGEPGHHLATSVASAATSTPRSPREATSAVVPARPPFVSSVTRGRRHGIDSVTVTPTDAGRRVDDPERVWREVLRLRPDLETQSLHDQLVCHALFARDKRVWHLEPARAAVGLAATVAAGCNPGSEPDPDDG